MRGWLGPLRDHQVRGWVYEPAQPDGHLRVEVRVDGEAVGTTTANLFFDHLAKAGIGKGDHGFVFNTDLAIPVEQPGRVEVLAFSAAGQPTRLRFAQQPAPGLAATPVAPQPAPARRELAFRFAASDAAQHPVFILGAARSGTSAMAQALTRGTRYAGHGEGHLLDLAATLLRTVEAHYTGRRGEWVSGINTMIAAVPQSFMEDAIRAGFVEMARSLFPTGWWLDKTPRNEMTAAAPALLRIWPDARFVYMRRRAIENIQSRRRKFPQMSFEEHCADWVANVTAWESVRDGLAGRMVVIDQHLLARDPARVVDVLGPFLSLDPMESAALLQALSFDRPERTSGEFLATASLADIGWTEEQRASFGRICGPAMLRCGYSDDADYFMPDRADAAIAVL